MQQTYVYTYIQKEFTIAIPLLLAKARESQGDKKGENIFALYSGQKQQNHGSPYALSLTIYRNMHTPVWMINTIKPVTLLT